MTSPMRKQLVRIVRIGPRKLIALLALLGAWLAADAFGAPTVVVVTILALGLLGTYASIEVERAEFERRRLELLSRYRTTTRELEIARRRSADTAQRLRQQQARSEQSRKAHWEEIKARDEAHRRRVHEAVGRERNRTQRAIEAGDVERQWRDIRASLRGLTQAREQPRLWAFPNLRMNSYLRMLYQELPAQGLDVIPMTKLDALSSIPSGDVFHYHWTKHIQSGCASPAEALRSAEKVLQQVEELRARGGHFVWSIHEAMPHECPFPEVEVHYRRRLAELADAVHVLHAGTIEELRGLYPVDPHKSFVVPHPLYTGLQADHVTRSTARAELGLRDDDVLLLCFGAIRPYKGFDRAVELLPDIQEAFPTRRVLLTIAGPTYRDPVIRDYVARLRQAASQSPLASSITLTPQPVPEQHIQYLFRAADVAVAPYRGGLNSGTLMMGLTFGLPTVIAGNAVTRDLARQGPVLTFEPGSDTALRDSILLAIRDTGRNRTVDPGFIRAHLPRAVSSSFANEIVRRLSLPSPTRTRGRAPATSR